MLRLRKQNGTGISRYFGYTSVRSTKFNGHDQQKLKAYLVHVWRSDACIAILYRAASLRFDTHPG